MVGGTIRSLVEVGSDRYALPPLACITLESVDEPGGAALMIADLSGVDPATTTDALDTLVESYAAVNEMVYISAVLNVLRTDNTGIKRDNTRLISYNTLTGVVGIGQPGGGTWGCADASQSTFVPGQSGSSVGALNMFGCRSRLSQ